MPRVNIKDGKVEGYLTVTEASKKLKESPVSVRQAIRDGRLPAVRLYRMWLIKAKDVDKFKKAGK